MTQGVISRRTAEALRAALELASGSMLLLAEAAGLSEEVLGMIRDGDRRAARGTAIALADKLERMADRHYEAACLLREALIDDEEQS